MAPSFDQLLVLPIVYPSYSSHTNIKLLGRKLGNQICCSLEIVGNDLICLLLEVGQLHLQIE